jgi:hypothetical protein
MMSQEQNDLITRTGAGRRVAGAARGMGTARIFWDVLRFYHRHSGAMRSIEPGIQGFPDVQLHI